MQVSSSFNGTVSNGINNLVGGYAAGFFNDEFVKIGVFQFGAPIAPGSVFAASTGATSFPNNNVTLGWALVTYMPAGDSDIPVDFFTANPRSDFLVEFDRMDHDEVDITTSRRLTATTVEGDNTEVECQALFLHFTN